MMNILHEEFLNSFYDLFVYVVLKVNGGLMSLEFTVFVVNIFLSFHVHCYRFCFVLFCFVFFSIIRTFLIDFFAITSGFHRSSVVISIPVDKSQSMIDS